jgi:uncharacterized protein YjbJ (UPF0337 family)
MLDGYITLQRSIAMNQSTKDRVQGKAHEVKGAVKEKFGRATNNPDLEAEGKGEKVAGKVQKKQARGPTLTKHL